MTARPSTPLDQAASTYLRGYLRRSGLTAAFVAERANISYMSLHRYMTGSRTMSLGDFIAILDVLGLTPEAVIERVRAIAADADSQ